MNFVKRTLSITVILWLLSAFLYASLYAREPASERYRHLTALHNKIRQKQQLAPLQWSNKLAHHAQEWADYLAENNQCRMKHRPLTGYYRRIYGENILWASPRRWLSSGDIEIQPLSVHDVIAAWADEKEYYDYANNRCQTAEQCGHYTQIVWQTSRFIGCGMTLCPDLGQLWVCNYDPPGNYVGERPY
jgi:pathogenesis-related protein 1